LDITFRAIAGVSVMRDRLAIRNDFSPVGRFDVAP
jgi:hypothetical protein